VRQLQALCPYTTSAPLVDVLVGAPLWSDTLNKLIKVRSAGRKPDEVEAEKQEAEAKAKSGR
jgi:hypothetical protein